MKRRWLYILIAFLIAYLMATSLRSGDRVQSSLANRASAYDAEILRDEFGVPHIKGQTDQDAAYGLAYAHAEDDFTTIQASLLAARGRLSSLLGAEGGPNDYMVAILRVTKHAAAGYAALDSATKALCDGYADGLNVYAARHRDDALKGLFPVTGQDIVAGFVHKTPLFFGLEKVLGSLVAQSTIGDSPGDAAGATGSNAFAVSPGRSAAGNTMLAVNSHQPWSGPIAWYEAHLMSEEGLNVVGGTFPGAPVILHGHNADLGWAHTVNDPDVIDLYDLTLHPSNPDLYLMDGEWVEFEREDASIPVKLIGKLQWTFEREMIWSRHGPVIRTDSGAVAVRFPGWGDAGQITQWYRMNRAKSLEEWYDAMSLQAIPVFNTVYADQEGHILYIYNARIPVREEGWDWTGRLPGDRSDLIWSEYVPFAELPQVLDPAVGFVQNANSTPFITTGTEDDPDVAAQAPESGIEMHQTNRSERALELFSSDESVTWEEFKAYKYDMRFSGESRAARLVRQLRFASTSDSLTRRAVDAIGEWDLGTEPANTGAAIAILTLGPFLSTYDSLVNTEALIGQARSSAEWLLANHGTLNPRWDTVNRLRRGSVDLGLGGAPDVLHAVYGNRTADGRLEGYQGDSYVLMVSFEDDGRVRSESINVFGTSTDPASPHYADQSPLFVSRTLKPVYFYEADVRAAAKSAEIVGVTR
ncbi:MAG: acyl-homoserine-lactone acylase [Rhodothermales bacterium]|jgi:acyl-homoserine-lactone acylase